MIKRIRKYTQKEKFEKMKGITSHTLLLLLTVYTYYIITRSESAKEELPFPFKQRHNEYFLQSHEYDYYNVL